jgi:hypothetical protein
MSVTEKQKTHFADLGEVEFRKQITANSAEWYKQHLGEDVVIADEIKRLREEAFRVIGVMNEFVSQALSNENGRATIYEIDLVAENKRPPVADGRRPHIEMRPWGMIEKFCADSEIPFVEREVVAREKGPHDPVTGHETGISRAILIDLSEVNEKWNTDMLSSFAAVTDGGSPMISGNEVSL